MIIFLGWIKNELYMYFYPQSLFLQYYLIGPTGAVCSAAQNGARGPRLTVCILHRGLSVVREKSPASQIMQPRFEMAMPALRTAGTAAPGPASS